MSSNILDLSPKEFYDRIPKEMVSNLNFRKRLHSYLANDKVAQKQFLKLCQEYLPIMFASCFFTLNPQRESSQRNVPFIPWSKKQENVIYELDKAIRNQKYDFGLEKTRKQGATEIVTKTFAAHTLLYEYSNFIVGSRVKNLVDNSGDFYTIFAKVDHAFDCLPAWMGVTKDLIERKDMSLKYLPTNSTINGETTNESFKAGSRSTALFLDEFGRVDKRTAEAIDGSIHDICNCVIYCSTHWLGPAHTFNRCIHSPNTHLETLYWHENKLPHDEVKGLWEVTRPGYINVIDKDYYYEKYPNFNWSKEIDIRELPSDIKEFVDVDIQNLDYKLRSVWHNKQYINRCSKPGGKRDFYCNIAGTPYGSSDSVFDSDMVSKVKEKVILPITEGTIVLDENGVACFDSETGVTNLKIYSPLNNDMRPNQSHNYVVSVDISWGKGSSNSVIEVMDVNNGEQIVEYADPNIGPDELADFSVDLCSWVGGVDEPYLIWESNGGQGVSFADRVEELGYSNVYTQRREDSKTRKKTDKLGWRSNPNMKEWLLSELNIALTEGLKNNPEGNFVRIFSKELCDELGDYMFSESGNEIITSSTADMSSGARKRHGDRVIAMAICLVGSQEQPKGNVEEIKEAPVGSFMYYQRQMEQLRAEELRTGKRYLY